MKRIILSLVLISILSCTKDNNSEQEPKQQFKKINSISIDGKLTYRYNYNDNALTNIWYYDENGDIYSKHEYLHPEESKMIEQYSYFVGGSWILANYYIYTYNSGYVILRKKYDSDDNYQGRASFNNKSSEAYNLVSATFYNQNDIKIYSFEIEYTDENGSSITKYYSDDNVLYKTETWTRDNKMGSYFTTSPFPYQHVNNLVSREVKYLNGTIADYSFTSVVEYDSDNYPTKKIKTYHDGRVETISFEYYKKN
jgi:hypothetical protein